MPLPGCGSGTYVVKRTAILQGLWRETEAMSEPHDVTPAPAEDAQPAPKILSPAAQRALAEAQARRAEIDARAADVASRKEIDGRGGLEPVRYNDWEVKGLTSDF
jgi:hypothetical protein